MVEELFFEMRKAERYLRNEGAPYGLSPLFLRAVFVILKTPNATADMLSQRLVADKALITRTVNSLMDMGLIEREHHPVDKRSFILKPSKSLSNIESQILKIEKGCENYIEEIREQEL